MGRLKTKAHNFLHLLVASFVFFYVFPGSQVGEPGHTQLDKNQGLPKVDQLQSGLATPRNDSDGCEMLWNVVRKSKVLPCRPIVGMLGRRGRQCGGQAYYGTPAVTTWSRPRSNCLHSIHTMLRPPWFCMLYSTVAKLRTSLYKIGICRVVVRPFFIICQMFLEPTRATYNQVSSSRGLVWTISCCGQLPPETQFVTQRIPKVDESLWIEASSLRGSPRSPWIVRRCSTCLAGTGPDRCSVRWKILGSHRGWLCPGWVSSKNLKIQELWWNATCDSKLSWRWFRAMIGTRCAPNWCDYSKLSAPNWYMPNTSPSFRDFFFYFSDCQTCP